MAPERLLRGARSRFQRRICADCRARYLYDEPSRGPRVPRCPRCRSLRSWPEA